MIWEKEKESEDKAVKGHCNVVQIRLNALGGEVMRCGMW